MANSFYLDASGLAKRYIPEKGFERVNAIFENLAPSRIHLLNIATGEILSVLVRKRNAGAMSIANFEEAVASFDAEIVGGMRVTKASVTSRLITGSFPLIISHSINSTDASP